MRAKEIVIETIAMLYIIMFMYASLTKILEFEKFQSQLGQSPILTSFSPYLVIVVPAIEIILSIGLAIKRFQYEALVGSYALMLCFTIYIIIILNFSPYVPCSCGGILENLTWTQHLAFNITFVMLSVIGILFFTNDKKNLLRDKRENRNP